MGWMQWHLVFMLSLKKDMIVQSGHSTGLTVKTSAANVHSHSWSSIRGGQADWTPDVLTVTCDCYV